MPFVNIPGLKGKLYVPDQSSDAPKKHRCADCFSCQMCADSRCRVCRHQKGEAETCRCLPDEPATDAPTSEDDGSG